MSTAYNAASVIIPNSAGVKPGTLQAWRPDVNLLQNIDVSRPATTNVASYVDNTGTRVFVGANVPRWDWSEGLSCPSLLVEEQRTNLFDQDLAGAGIATQTVTVVNGNTYTVSVEGSGSMTLSGAGTGTVTEGSHVTFTASTTSLTLTLSGALDYCQVEAGSYPSSIIYTSGSIATRNADVISKTGIANLIGQSEGALFFEIEFFKSINYIGFSDGTKNNRLLLGIGGTDKLELFLAKNNFSEVFEVGSLVTYNTYHKMAASYAANDFVAVLDGVVDVSSSSGNTFDANTIDEIKFSDAGNNLFAGRIRTLAWWKTRLTNAEIQSLTTP